MQTEVLVIACGAIARELVQIQEIEPLEPPKVSVPATGFAQHT